MARSGKIEVVAEGGENREAPATPSTNRKEGEKESEKKKPEKSSEESDNKESLDSDNKEKDDKEDS